MLLFSWLEVCKTFSRHQCTHYLAGSFQNIITLFGKDIMLLYNPTYNSLLLFFVVFCKLGDLEENNKDRLT